MEPRKRQLHCLRILVLCKELLEISEENRMKKISWINALTVTLLLIGNICIGQTWATTTNMMLILDASGRMSGKFPGQTTLSDPTKMQIVSNVLQSFLTGLPKTLNVGLEVYGRLGDRDCSDFEVMSPIEPVDAMAIMNNVGKLSPERGGEPLTKALELGAETLGNVQGDKFIVLLSNGKDSCGGDPIEAAHDLKEQNITIYVVGIDVKEDEIAQLSGISVAANGQYFAVTNRDDLEKSLTAIGERIVNKTTEHNMFFRDDFIGESLTNQWHILNTDKNSMYVKNGAATIIAKETDPKKATNVLLIGAPAPSTDWIVEASFSAVPHSRDIIFELGALNSDHSQQILAQVHMNFYPSPAGNIFYIFLRGVEDIKSSSSRSHYKRLVSYKPENPKQRSHFFKDHIKSITVKLKKMGNEYSISAKLVPVKEGDKMVPSEWVSLQKFTSSLVLDDSYFIRTYLKDQNGYGSRRSKEKVDINWVEVQTIQHERTK